MGDTNIRLIRTAWHLNFDAVLGFLQVNDIPICLSMERLFAGKPKIPIGRWPFVLDKHHPGTPKEYMVPELRGVPGHDNLQIHIANHIRELNGCVASGESFVKAENEILLYESGTAFSRLMGHVIGPGYIEVIEIKF